MAKAADRPAFMRDFIAATDPASEPDHRLWNGAVTMLVEEQPDCALRLGDNELYLSSIVAEERGLGHGRLAMEFLLSLGREHNVDIVLHAEPLDDRDGPGESDLLHFYRSLGFKRCGPNNLMFCPAAPAND